MWSQTTDVQKTTHSLVYEIFFQLSTTVFFCIEDMFFHWLLSFQVFVTWAEDTSLFYLWMGDGSNGDVWEMPYTCTKLLCFSLTVQLESKAIPKYYHFHCPGIDNQTFGTVAESEENWTQRAKTEWETSWQGKILVNNVVVSFEFLQNASREKKILKKFWFWKGGGNYTQIWREKSFKFFKNVHVGCNVSSDWVQRGDTQLKVLVWGWQHWGNRCNNSLFI